VEDSPDPILIILHQEASSPGRVGVRLRQMGYRLDIRKPRFGDELPKTMNHHSGCVIFGGPMSANDKDDFISREIDWIGVALEEEKPFLGICLGAQMLVKHLGCEVAEHAQGKAEIGYYPIEPTPEGRHLLSWPGHVYQWHREGFELPDAARLLATGDTYENQAFVFGKNAYGIQFHPEVNLAMMHKWTVRGAARFQLPGAQTRDQHFMGRARYDAPLKAWLYQFLDFWLPGNDQNQ